MGLRRRIRARLEEGEDRRRFVEELFDRIAGRYDLTNDVMSLGLHRRWKRRLLERARLAPHHTILDLAAGTGDLALAASEVVSSGSGRVVAGDLTRRMLEVGRRRRGAHRVHWLRCDALRLPFPDASLDRVLIGYGLRNFADLPAALKEIHRCLVPGGMLVTLDFGKPRSPGLRRLYLRYLEISTAIVGWLLHRDPGSYLYIPESLKVYPAQEDVRKLMVEAGFDECGWEDLLLGTMALHHGRRRDELSPRPPPSRG